MATETRTAAELTAAIAQLDRAIDSGVQTVAFADGKRVTYKSTADMAAARAKLCRALDPASGITRKVVAHTKGTTPTGSPWDWTR